MVTDLLYWCRFAGTLSIQDGGQGQPLARGPWPLPLPEHPHGVSRQFTYNNIVYPTVVEKKKNRFCAYSSASYISYIWFHRTGSPTAHVTVGILLALIPVTKLTPTKNHFQYCTLCWKWYMHCMRSGDETSMFAIQACQHKLHVCKYVQDLPILHLYWQ